MRFFTSGIASQREYTIAKNAGVTDFLVDPTDLGNVNPVTDVVMLDSGAYRNWKLNVIQPVSAYLEFIQQQSGLHSIIAPDVFGDAEASYVRWCQARQFVPVWSFDGPVEFLQEYLKASPVVGIGGLVPLMREKDEAMLEKLASLCEQFPQRFHIFGLSWLKAIDRLKPLLASADASLFMRGARKHRLIYWHTKQKRLADIPKKLAGLGNVPTDTLCELNAKNLMAYFAGMETTGFGAAEGYRVQKGATTE